MNAIAEEVFRILLSLVAGGIIGLEREVRDKTAGFRTLIFISMGATLFTILSARLADGNDPSRISANIITGIGFLGAGAILREGARIIGLTTAATIWLTAALGMAIGGGQYLLAGVALIVSTVVLWIFPLIEAGIDALRELHTYEILSEPDLDLMQQIESEVKTCGLHLRSKRFWKENGKLRCSWNVRGSPRKHKKFR
ncbi:MAG: MgtC/SapB family protein, partial [Anaerolineales bacterium]|nr:MgtC/SapB family protein [Anaerolineales bacterium]